MSLLEHGALIPDPWIPVADEAPLPDGPALLGLDRLRREPLRDAPLGVLVPGETPAAELAEQLPKLVLIAVRFPVFKDGRGFTLGRTLREHHGFVGVLRATGHILPDQYLFLLRCGFSQVAFAGDPAPWLAALHGIRIGYQAALTDDAPLSLQRRRLAVG